MSMGNAIQTRLSSEEKEFLTELLESYLDDMVDKLIDGKIYPEDALRKILLILGLVDKLGLPSHIYCPIAKTLMKVVCGHAGD